MEIIETFEIVGKQDVLAFFGANQGLNSEQLKIGLLGCTKLKHGVSVTILLDEWRVLALGNSIDLRWLDALHIFGQDLTILVALCIDMACQLIKTLEFTMLARV